MSTQEGMVAEDPKAKTAQPGAPSELKPIEAKASPAEAPAEPIEPIEPKPVDEAAPAPARKQRRGFAAMDPAAVRAIARKGGVAAHERGTAHRFTQAEAREAGRKGGLAPHRSRGGPPKHAGA